MVASQILGELYTYDALLAEAGPEVPAVGLLAQAWSAEPLAAVVQGAPRPWPAWSDFDKTGNHLLSRRKPLRPEQWAAAASFAARTAGEDPVLAVLLGLLVASAWEGSADGTLDRLFRGDQETWQKVFLPLTESLIRVEATWSARLLCELAIETLSDVGWEGGDAVERDRIVAQFRRFEATAAATIRDATNELVWRLAASAGRSPASRLDAATLCWLLGDSARAGHLRDDGDGPSLDCADFIVRRSLAEVRRDPFLEAGWQRLADSGVLAKSPELMPVYYRLTRTSDRQRLEMDFPVAAAGGPKRTSRLVYQAVHAWLGGHRDEIDAVSLQAAFDRANDVYFHEFFPAYARITALLLLVTESSAETSEHKDEAARWQWEKFAVGASEKLWNDTVDNVEGLSADLAGELVFQLLPSHSAADRSAALELLEAYRSAGLEYALTVTPPLAGSAPDGGQTGPAADAALRAELRGLRFRQAIGRLPHHMRYYYGPEEDLAPGGALSPQRVFNDGDANRSRQREVLAEIERHGGDAYARPKGYGLMRPGSGRVLIDFRNALRFGPAETGAGDHEAGEPSEDAEFGPRLERAQALRAAGDLARAREQLEEVVALAGTRQRGGGVLVARASNILGNVLQEIGDLDGAERCYLRALALHQAEHGFIHSAVAADWHNLGTLAYSRGGLLLARVRVERALAIDTAIYGSQDSEVATDHMTLGRIAAAGLDLTGACKHYRRAVEIRQEVLAANHPSTAKASMALADTERLARALNLPVPAAKSSG